MIDKEIHLAPLQGYTDIVFRRLFASYFGGVDFYYTPFIRIERGDFRQRDLRELAADELDNLVPQILPANADELNRLTDVVCENGYKRIDVNIGCPFPPIAAHGKGCVLFNYPDRLREILSAMANRTDVEYSMKIRLGFTSADQWREVVDNINDTPLRHVTAHARYGKQQYKGECDMAAFGQFVEACKHKVIYNGDIRSVEKAEEICCQFPTLLGIMVGRGVLSDLSLARKMKGLEELDTNNFRRFHSELVDAHQQHMSGDKQLLGKLQPYWEYLYPEAEHKLRKNIMKANKLDVYLNSVAQLLRVIDQKEKQE